MGTNFPPTDIPDDGPVGDRVPKNHPEFEITRQAQGCLVDQEAPGPNDPNNRQAR